MKQIQHKYKKTHKISILRSEQEFKRLSLLYGSIALQSLGSGRLKNGQLEALRRTIKKIIKKEGILWFRVFLDRAITAKPSEVRMGKGKGNFSENVAVVKQGTIILELGGSMLNKKKAIFALNQAKIKLPIKTKIVEYSA